MMVRIGELLLAGACERRRSEGSGHPRLKTPSAVIGEAEPIPRRGCQSLGSHQVDAGSVDRMARDRSPPGRLGGRQQPVSPQGLDLLGYGVGVLGVAERRASVTISAVASSSPSLRTSPAMAGGKRAESPSRKVKSVSAAIASGSAGTGVPRPPRRETVIGTSTWKVNAPAAV